MKPKQEDLTQEDLEKVERSVLYAEINRLREENEALRQENQGVAFANVYAAELVLQLEEANEKLCREIEKRKRAEESLLKAHST